jgi:hypothetical protein
MDTGGCGERSLHRPSAGFTFPGRTLGEIIEAALSLPVAIKH